MSAFKKEVAFGVDSFKNPKSYNRHESVALMLMNLLTMRPGNIPGLPNIGIDIRQYLYKFEDEIDTGLLKDKIYSQASEFLPYLISGEINVLIKKIDNQTVLLVSVPINTDTGDDAIYFGFTKDSNGGISSKFQFDKVIKR